MGLCFPRAVSERLLASHGRSRVATADGDRRRWRRSRVHDDSDSAVTARLNTELAGKLPAENNKIFSDANKVGIVVFDCGRVVKGCCCSFIPVLNKIVFFNMNSVRICA